MSTRWSSPTPFTCRHVQAPRRVSWDGATSRPSSRAKRATSHSPPGRTGSTRSPDQPVMCGRSIWLLLQASDSALLAATSKLPSGARRFSLTHNRLSEQSWSSAMTLPHISGADSKMTAWFCWSERRRAQCDALNPDRTRPKPRPLGVRTEATNRHSCPGPSVSCRNPVCPFGCQLGRHVRLDCRGPKSSTSVGTEVPSVDRHPKEAVRRSLEGWAPPQDQCLMPKREAGDPGLPGARPKPSLSPSADSRPPSTTEAT
jgi:hypothetical protein